MYSPRIMGVAVAVFLTAHTVSAACTLSARNADAKSNVRLKDHPGCEPCKTCYWEWASFPCASGIYDIYIDAWYERDGAPPYWIFINGTEVASGKYGYCKGSHSCNDCMEHHKHLAKKGVRVCKGDKIMLRGKCVHEGCGDHGAYLRNEGLILELQGSASGCGGTTGPVCGNGQCESGEDCSSCAGDCGACEQPGPYGASPVDLPGRIEAEEYDKGGEGSGYHDADPANQGGKFRDEGVDIEACSEGGYNVGWIQAGEWLAYTVNVSYEGSFGLELRVAGDGGALKLLMDNAQVGEEIPVVATAGWQEWQTVTAPAAPLSRGEHVLKILFVKGGFNLNYVSVKASGTAVTVSAMSAGVVRGPGARGGTLYDIRGRLTNSRSHTREPDGVVIEGCALPDAAVGRRRLSVR